MVHTDLDDPDAEGNQVLDLAEPSKVSPLIVICHCPEAAHKLYARSTSMNHNPKPIVEFISQPCGPRKLARSIELCLKRMEGQEPYQHEETRWVELPESSHLPLDIGPRDAPDERMKVSKRLAEEKNDEQQSRKPINDGTSLPDEPGTVPEATVPDAIAENDPPSVLLVEDNPINLDILVAYTRKEGWSSMTAQNGLEAFERFQEHPGKFALVIIDISMPVMNGFEASQRIRQFERKYFDAHPELKPSWHPTTIVALTGLDSRDAQHEAFASGINVFLTKPISRAKIRTLLENL
jgi:CheY-like chemotaxis protein